MFSLLLCVCILCLCMWLGALKSCDLCIYRYVFLLCVCWTPRELVCCCASTSAMLLQPCCLAIGMDCLNFLYRESVIYFCKFSYVSQIYLILSSGTGIPTGIKSPTGNGDGEEMFPVNVHGDGDGENSSPRGRGWWHIPRRGIPRCHLDRLLCDLRRHRLSHHVRLSH